ncbi:MAG: hypothetical protein F6K54_36125 [Okeania sp. SIO3B5]|uniref:hypothetical protein n=1 Tax=Okeania sp. SIO3B5 TaxID=2607811 RepID=UPI00140096BE|nr:hypothetical protein [Okeania sp. SIO3B5]NEO58011.1 hypothetical protein [Okeania sp. SIO3B5]
MSNLLWSHTKIGSFDLASICESGSAPYTLAKSWFTAELNFLPFAQHSVSQHRPWKGNRKWLKTSFQSSTVSVQGCIHLKSLRIRVYPEKNLHQIWKKWLAASRYCFNQAIAYQRKYGLISKYNLRKVILNNESLPDWIKESPYHLKVNAIYDAHAAFKASSKSGTKQPIAENFVRLETEYNQLNLGWKTLKKVLGCH